MNPRRHRFRPRPAVPIPPRLEPLEDRIAPAISIVMAPGAGGLIDVTVTGDDQVNNISVIADKTGALKHNLPTGSGTFASAADFDATTPGEQQLNASQIGTMTVNSLGGNDIVKVNAPVEMIVDAGTGDDSINLAGKKVTVEMGAGADSAKLKGDEINATDSAVAKFLKVILGTASLREKLDQKTGTDVFSLTMAAVGQNINLDNTNDPATAVLASLLLRGKAIDSLVAEMGGEDNTVDAKARTVGIMDTGGTNNFKIAATQNVSATMTSGTNTVTVLSGSIVAIFGGPGNDILTGARNGTNTISGNGGTDRLTGGNMNDNISTGVLSEGSTIMGLGGNDTLDIQGVDTKYFGGTGNDTATITGINSFGDLGEGNDSAEVISGGHTVVGGPGNDQLISQSTSASPDTIVTLNGGSGNDLVSSTSALPHQLIGGPGNDSILGGSGADTLDGGSGTDSLDGGPGNDIVNGGGGLFDSYHYDHSNTSDNFIITITGTGASTNSTAPGNPGTDTISRISSFVVSGNDGNNTIDASGSKMELLIFGEGGNDIITGGQGLNKLSGGAGDDTITAGTGKSVLSEIIPSDAAAVVTLTNTTFNGAGADTLSGLSGAIFDSLGGIDRTLNFSAFTGGGVTYRGGGNKETIIGTAGNDILEGGGDDDRFILNGGSDRIDGGSGVNTLGYGDFILTPHESAGRGTSPTLAGATVSISGLKGTAIVPNLIENKVKKERSAFFNIQIHEGTELNDNFTVVTSNAFVPTIRTFGGNDTVFASGGGSIAVDLGDDDDKLKLVRTAGQILGGKGNDTFDLKNSRAPSIIDGGDGDDTFFCKNEVIDNITGGLGADTAFRDLDDVIAVDVESRSP